MTYAASPAAPLAVLGAGAWGTVIANLLAANGHVVRLWAHRPEHAERLSRERLNRQYLPGVPLLPRIDATNDVAAALKDAALAFVVVPSRAFRGLISRLPQVPALVSCSKGIESGSFSRLSQIIEQERPGASVAALSGPNLASEIAAGKPAATTVASKDAALATHVQELLQQASFRVYTSTDIVGVELGGAMKNVIALAAGMSDGIGLGDNAKATIITRGLAELVRMGTALGGLDRTFYGLAGLGDLVATCASRHSRNHSAGERIARGETREQLEREQLTAEGIPTVKAAHEYAVEAGVDLPITNEVYRVVYEGKPPSAAMRDLMTRERKAE